MCTVLLPPGGYPIAVKYVKGKAIPLQAWTDPGGSRRLSLPDFKTIGTWRWKKLSALRTGRLYPQDMFLVLISVGGTRWRSWLRHCITSQKVAGSIPDSVSEIFHWHNPSGRTMALRSTHPLTEMSTRDISWG